MTRSKYQKIIQFAALLLFSNQALSQAFSNPPLLRNDPKRPSKEISQALGITQNQFIECFSNVSPAQGSNPTTKRVHSNKKILLSCLQKANPDISNEKLDEVMDAQRPGGHKAQEPTDR